jgi:HD-like signal output (HDOD) protein
MGLRDIRRQAAMATGNFSSIFDGLEVPALPAAALRVGELCGEDDSDFDEIARCIETDAALTTAVLRLANSAAYARGQRALTVKDAVVTLGLTALRHLSLGWAVVRSVQLPKTDAMDLSQFWASSLLRALTARNLASVIDRRNESVAFTGALLADVAIPMLLHEWAEFYEPVVRRWRDAGGSLIQHEEQAFEWSHAQSGAWVARSWSLPDELVCAVGFHHATPDELRRLELVSTPVAAVVLASTFGDALQPTADELSLLEASMKQLYQVDREQLEGILVMADEQFDEVAAALGVSSPARVTLTELLGNRDASGGAGGPSEGQSGPQLRGPSPREGARQVAKE